jgi:hypothetical protein
MAMKIEGDSYKIPKSTSLDFCSCHFLHSTEVIVNLLYFDIGNPMQTYTKYFSFWEPFFVVKKFQEDLEAVKSTKNVLLFTLQIILCHS